MTDSIRPPDSLWERFIRVRKDVYLFFATLDRVSSTEISEVQHKLGINGHESDADTRQRLRMEMQKIIKDVCEGKESKQAPKRREYLINFTDKRTDNVKQKLTEFAVLAKKEKFPTMEVNVPPPDVSQAIENLTDPMRFGTERAYTMSNPMKLGRFFTKQYMKTAVIKYQSRIYWDTSNGLPEFHDIWELPADQLTNIVRKEAIQLELFKHQQLIPGINLVAPQAICPPIYSKLKQDGRWQKVTFNRERNKLECSICSFPEWITSARSDLEAFLENQVELFDFGQHICAQNTVYCYVWKDENAEDYLYNARREGQCSDGRRKPSSVLIYIGKAKNGVQDRWIYNHSSHCAVASRLLSHTARLHINYEKYVANKNESTPTLVDCCHALSVTRASECALFVLKSLTSELAMEQTERELIEDREANDIHVGLNGRTGN